MELCICLCVLLDINVIRVIISIVATKTVMCRKDAAAILTATGGASYLWNTNAVTTTLSASSAVANSTTYSVTGADANGCVNTATILIKVNTCTGINELNTSGAEILIYPNPNNGTFKISAQSPLSLYLINELGQTIRVIDLNNENAFKADISDLSKGVYFIVGSKENLKIHQKIIVTK